MLWKQGRAIRGTRQIAAHHEIDDKIKMFIERIIVCTQVSFADRCIQVAINIPSHLIIFPFERKNMKFIMESAVSKRGTPGDISAARAWPIMDRTKHPGRFTADIFHQVNLPTAWPCAIYVFLWQ